MSYPHSQQPANVPGSGYYSTQQRQPTPHNGAHVAPGDTPPGYAPSEYDQSGHPRPGPSGTVYGRPAQGAQDHAGQDYGGQGYPAEGNESQGYPGSQGYPAQDHPGQGYPGQGYPGQGYPAQGYPAQGYPAQGYPAPGYAAPGQGQPAQGYPGQGYPGQGYPGQGYPGQGYGAQGYGAQPGAAAQGYPAQAGYPAAAGRPEIICRFCGCVPAAKVTFRGHQGMIFLMRFLHLEGPFCRNCGLATFRRMTERTLIQGWWGYASSIITPITILVNLIRLPAVSRLDPPRRHPSVQGPAPDPMDPGKPLLARPMALFGMAIPVLIALIIVIAVTSG